MEQDPQKKPTKYIRDCEDGSSEDWTYRIEYLRKTGNTAELEKIKKLKGWRKP